MGYWRNLMMAALVPPLRALSGYEAAASTRRTLLERADREGAVVALSHLPAPGLGRFGTIEGDRRVWVPLG